jgi:hypothetical protein
MTEIPPRERRRYARHPIRVPTRVRPRGGLPEFQSRVADLSEGGLCFDSPEPLPLETTVDISLPIADERFTVVGTVVRSVPSETGDAHVIGVAFVHPAMSFRMKIAEQVLRIQELRRELSRELGREVPNEEAADRWVADYAKDFAELYA